MLYEKRKLIKGHMQILSTYLSLFENHMYIPNKININQRRNVLKCYTYLLSLKF